MQTSASSCTNRGCQPLLTDRVFKLASKAWFQCSECVGPPCYAWAKGWSGHEEKGAERLETIKTALFRSPSRTSKKKKEEKNKKSSWLFSCWLDKSNRCKMTYEQWGSAVEEALHLFLSQFTSQSDIIIYCLVRTEPCFPEVSVSFLQFVAVNQIFRKPEWPPGLRGAGGHVGCAVKPLFMKYSHKRCVQTRRGQLHAQGWWEFLWPHTKSKQHIKTKKTPSMIKLQAGFNSRFPM